MSYLISYRKLFLAILTLSLDDDDGLRVKEIQSLVGHTLRKTKEHVQVIP